MGDPVFVKDHQSRLVLVNDAFCKVFGRDRAEIIGKTLAEDVSPEEREHFLKVDQQVLTDGKESVVEETLTIRGGSTKTISTRKTRFIDESGNKFLVGVIRDITEIKHAEELSRLNRYNELLLRAARILSRNEKNPEDTLQEFTETLSHHFAAVCDISVLDDSTGLIIPRSIHYENIEVKRIIKNLFETNKVKKGQGLVGKVIESGQEILIETVPDSMKVGPRLVDSRIVPQSIMYVPLKGSKTVLGSLNLTRLEGQPSFDQAHADQIRRLAEYVSLFVENALLKQEQQLEAKRRIKAERHLESEKKWAEFKLETSTIFADVHTDLSDILQQFSIRVSEYFNVVCDIQLVDQETKTISAVALYHPDEAVEKAIDLHLSNRKLKIGEGMIGSVVASGKEYYLPELTAELREIVVQRKLNPIIIPSSFVYVPLSSHDQVLGTLDLTRLSHQETLKEQDLVKIRDLATHASIFVENRLLQASQKREIELRKKAESKLERNRIMLERMEAETRAMLNAIPIFIARLSKALQYLFLNETYRTMGLQPNSMEGKFIREVIGDEALKKLKPNFDRVLSGESISYDYEGTMADGTYRYMNVALAPDISEDGSVIGFYSCSTDVTSKVEAERAAKSTQDRMETLSLNSGDAFFFHDSDQLILDVNQVACDMLGYTREEFLAMRAFEIDPRWKGKSYMKFLERLEPNYPQTFDTTVFRKDGTEVPVEVRFVKRKEGKKNYIQSLVRDRTEKHEQEMKLQQSEQRLRLLFNSVEDSIAIIDEKGAIETINKTFQGIPVSDVIGASIFDFYRDEQVRSFVKVRFQDLVETGTGFELEDSFTGPDGTTNVYSIKYNGIFHEGKFYKAIAIVRDITAERGREHSVMNAVLLGQEQERKRLGAELHDGIGQVLSAIALQVSQIREEVVDVDKEIITNELNTLNAKLQSAIREVRDISHDLMPEVLESFGLNEAINQVCRNLHDRSGIQVKFDSVDMEDAYDPHVEVNLYRIAQELLNNVQKHACSKKVFVSLMDHGDAVSLTVEDDGKGFDPDADVSGIGLKNIRSRIKMLGGQIDVESAENSGTLVNIEVPKKKE